MSLLRHLVARDVKLALRSGGGWALSLVFFALFLSLSAIALGGSIAALRPVGQPLIVLAFALAALMSSSSTFTDDLADGTLEQAKLSGAGWMTLASAKLIAVTLITLIPLVIAIPMGALLFGLTSVQITGLIIAMTLALPGIAGFICVAGALTAGQGRGGVLGILIAAPLLVPLLIFTIAGSAGFTTDGISTVGLRLLAGVSLIGLVTALPATAAALSAQVD